MILKGDVKSVRMYILNDKRYNEINYAQERLKPVFQQNSRYPHHIEINEFDYA